MKANSFVINGLMVLSLIIASPFFFDNSIKGQPFPSGKLTEDDLLKRGQQSYDDGNYTKASIYWYAYLQRKPTALNDEQFKSTFMQCLDYSLQKSESNNFQGNGLAGVSSKADGEDTHNNIYSKKPVLRNTPSASSNYKIQSVGSWSCNDGGIYYIRKLDNEIWWYGQSRDSLTSWATVMHGVINGNIITGQWADIPKGKTSKSGQITLQIDSNKHLRTINSTGGLIGSQWDANNIMLKVMEKPILLQINNSIKK